MCGRFASFLPPDAIRALFGTSGAPPNHAANYNVAPTQPVAVISNAAPNRIDYFNWGLIPPWAKDPSVGGRMINARVETIAEKAAYAKPFRRRRCLALPGIDWIVMLHCVCVSFGVVPVDFESSP